jgi:hypothetical protein
MSTHRRRGRTQPPTQWTPGVKQPGREADHLAPSSAEVKNGGDISYLPICLNGILLIQLNIWTSLPLLKLTHFLSVCVCVCVCVRARVRLCVNVCVDAEGSFTVSE